MYVLKFCAALSQNNQQSDDKCQYRLLYDSTAARVGQFEIIVTSITNHQI